MTLAIILLVVTLIVNMILMIWEKSTTELKDPKKRALFWARVFLPVIILVIGIVKNLSDDNKARDASKKLQEEKDSIQKNELDFRNKLALSDSTYNNLLTQKIDSTANRNIKNTNEALAKYNLIYVDSLNRIVSTVKSKTSLPNLTIAAVDPFNTPPFFLDTIDGKPHLKIRFVSEYNVSHNVFLLAYIFGFDSDIPNNFSLKELYPTMKLLSGKRLTYRDQISSENYRTTTLPLELPQNYTNRYLLILINGRYYNYENYTEKREYNYAFIFDKTLKKEVSNFTKPFIQELKDYYKIQSL